MPRCTTKILIPAGMILGWESITESQRRISGKAICMRQRWLFSAVLKIRKNTQMAVIIMDIHLHPAVYRCRLIVAMVTAACRMRKCILITWKAVTWEAIPVVTKRKVNQRKILYQRNHLAEWKFRYICREIMHQSHGEIRLWQSQDVGLPVWQW